MKNQKLGSLVIMMLSSIVAGDKDSVNHLAQSQQISRIKKQGPVKLNISQPISIPACRGNSYFSYHQEDYSSSPEGNKPHDIVPSSPQAKFDFRFPHNNGKNKVVSTQNSPDSGSSSNNPFSRSSPNYTVSPVSIITAAALMNKNEVNNSLRTSQK